MAKYPNVTKLTGVEPLTKFYVVAVVVFFFVVSISMRDQVGSWKWWAAAYFIGSTLTHVVFLACHEISHNLAFRNNPTANKLFMIFTSTPLPIPFAMEFRRYHLEHHKMQGTDGVDTDLPTDIEARSLQHPVLKFFFLATILVSYSLRPLFVRPKAPEMWNIINIAYILVADVLIIKLFGWGPIWFALAAMVMCSLHPLAGHFLAEHMVFNGNYETYSYYGILNKLTWNVGYHNEHHDFPGVAWTRLPELRKAAPEFYENIPQHGSWVAVMWNFVTMPNINLYNRVKRRPPSKKKK